ncbi:hypothetical protein TMatcc_003136 [Talaromyces marneffei ATCC 18224]|uniref:Uncharacterized protein n=2 Tax=Talaromyces marneffei TaxID=37727 RepID=B6Q5Z3_TALMQ|nr:uncharacterized protein EYB26_001814 [Talaromyces marneffei]EEA28532.1 conserved hypothetical protein [Talaromyces marneffei ATCC 18224]KAE8555843.1 hypothetical protein EYB25_000541 [Talaromyces marneffei]QGA14161.1 hypothetical protein EYB26_001814 [Talaromyces marneffei]
MAANPMDALQCFTSISDSVPSWITRVTELAAHTSRKHAEFSEEFKHLATTNSQLSSLQRRQKNSSVHSIRPGSDLLLKPSGVALDASSNVSGDPSLVVRVRRQLVIYYDSHTQAELEQTVRDIGNARNSLRKGKMSQLMRKSANGLDMFVASRSREPLRGMQLPPLDGFRRRAAGALITTTTTTTSQNESAFEFADKQLDIAQSLCETAAHQFLRRGDCAKELEDMLAKFKTVLQTATQEATRLREEKEQEAEEQQQTNGSPTYSSRFKPFHAVEDDKPPEPGSATIEVDDTVSDSSISIDITAFRSNRFRM